MSLCLCVLLVLLSLTPFKYLYIFVLFWFVFILSYSTFLYVCFPQRESKKVCGLWEVRLCEDLRGVGGGETMIRVYCMKKILQLRNNNS